MAVNLPPLGVLHPVAGVRLGTVAAGIRKRNRRDLVVIEVAAGASAAAVFTRNRFCAAPVTVAKQHLVNAMPRALVINTGFANAGTGAEGIEDARRVCGVLADILQCRPEEVLPFSTGVIGERLPVDRIAAGLPSAVKVLDQNGWHDAAHGIMTTDTAPKGVSRQILIDGRTVTVTGITKGAGMICPNMATMLAFVATDAQVDPDVLNPLLAAAADASFNRISVDGDTSTNDACVVLATGASGVAIAGSQSQSHALFAQVLCDVLAELAQSIIRDAEGATKFITIDVEQGTTESDCLEVAHAVAHSPLVKTAFFASDPNWGRILAAVGRARIPHLNTDAVSIWLDDQCIVRNGGRAPDYTEEQGNRIMKQSEIRLRITLGTGMATARLWTCDLSHDYIKINAEYRT